VGVGCQGLGGSRLHSHSLSSSSIHIQTQKNRTKEENSGFGMITLTGHLSGVKDGKRFKQAYMFGIMGHGEE
jgi:hypothetical protein